MERDELETAAAALLSESPRALRGDVKEDLREQWFEQLTSLLQDVLSHAEMWGLLPEIARDRPPPGVDPLGMTLCFIDSAALYRVVPWVSKDKLVMRVERTPFSTPMRVNVSDNRNCNRVMRSWQFLNEEQNFNLHGSEGPYSTRFVRELARRFGWPLRPDRDDSG